MHIRKFKPQIGLYTACFLMGVVTSSCSDPQTSSNNNASQTAAAPAQSYMNSSEMALLGLAHRKFPEDSIFANEIISESSGEKRVCGNISSDGQSKRYIFSLTEGLNRYPSEDAWQRDCSNGWTPGTGA